VEYQGCGFLVGPVGGRAEFPPEEIKARFKKESITKSNNNKNGSEKENVVAPLKNEKCRD
jgi:hypothetical protein